jgi:photosystem II stability/assembly factor-like uncharacterized protein
MSLSSHPIRRVSVLATAVFLLSPIAPRFNPAGSKAPSAPSVKPPQHRANQTAVGAPIFFEPNLGQAPADVRFVSRNLGQGLEVRTSGFELGVARSDQPRPWIGPLPAVPGRRARHIQRGAARATISASFVGASPSTRVEAIDQAASRSSYFIGNDPSRWLANLPNFERIAYRGVWPGIDVYLYGKGGRSEYDIVLAPGAALADARIAFKGSSGLSLDRGGNLIVSTPAGKLVQPKPTVYQPGPAGRILVAGEYRVLGDEEIGFQVAACDPALPLIIDPVISYSTYLGLSGNNSASAIATLPGGEVLVTGDAESSFTDLTASVSGSFFVAKFGADDSLIYLTVLGADEHQSSGSGIAVDAAGNAIVSGSTYSPNFPVTPGAIQTQFSGSFDAFVVKLGPDGSTLLYATLLGGDGVTLANGVAVDESGQAYVTGFTTSPDFPITPGAFQTVAQQKTYNGFVSKLSPAGDRLLYSTFLTGSAAGDYPPTTFANAIAVDSSGSAYVTGYSDATDLGTPGAFQTTPKTTEYYQAFVARVAPDGGSLLYATFLSADGGSEGNAIALDGQGNAYLTGTAARGFPTTRGAYQTKYRGTRGFGGEGDAFVAELNPAGSALVFSTYLGGTGGDSGKSIVVDPSGFVVVAGTTSSTDFPLAHAIQQTNGGGTLFKSSDGGKQWSPARAGLTSPSVTALVIHPKSHTTLFAGTANDGVYKSIDAGASWTPTALTDSEVFSLVWAGPDASALYAVSAEGLFRTADGGSNWEGLPLTLRNSPSFVAVDPTDPATLYIDQPAAGSGFAIYKSTDAGSTWAETGLRNQYDLSLVIDPARPSDLFAGSSDGVFRSTDGGITWAQTPVGGRLIAPLIAGGGEPPTLIALLFDDIMTSDDAGKTWKDTGTVWRTPGIVRIAVAPSNPNLVYGATTTRLLLSRDFVFDFAPADRGLGNVFVNTVAVDPQNTAVVYAGTGNGVYDSFVARFDAAGKNLLFSTYIGGSGNDGVGGIALRPDGSVLIAGETSSQNFATTAGALQTVFSPYPSGQWRDLHESSGYLLEFPAPLVKGVTADGADLVVSGANFDSEATVLVDGVPQKTRPMKKAPAAVLIAVGAAARLRPGQTVQIQVANSDMTPSRSFAFTP